MPDPRPAALPPPDPAARATAQGLLGAAHAALAYLDPASRAPGIARIAFGRTAEGGCATLISSLAAHHAGLQADPACAVLLGEPGARGDPLTHPRLMLEARAIFVEREAPLHAALRQSWLAQHPKAGLYVDFADFGFVRLLVRRAVLNGGFGRAFTLTPEDLGMPPEAAS